MLQPSNLILLTKQFPFHHREQYVAHELAVLSKHFDHIYIYPHDHFGKGDKPTFELPGNVEVIELNQKIVPASKAAVIISFLKAFLFEWIHTHDRMWLLKNLRRFYAIYATQFALGNGLVEFLRNKNLSQQNTTLYSYWFSASALCLSILRNRGLIQSFVSRAHALDLYHEGWGLLNERVRVLPFRYFKQKHTDVIYSISAHGKNFLLKKPNTLNKVEVAYLGVQDFGLNPDKPNEKFTIVTCSGVDDNKRIHLLGEALSAIDLPVHWIHFGDGPLKEMALKSVTGSQVQFDFRGQTSNTDIRNFYASHHVDLFVNLSRVEGLPVTIMEAISHGIPVLATDANGTPEAVLAHQNGKLISTNFNQQSLCNELMWFMTNIDQLRNMRIKSRAVYMERFNA
ncbi:MAG: glycosyltransferase, partial [Flavobacteriales bacterium]|nr:glycosyltransferase [Flavobacteriales bacterium]